VCTDVSEPAGQQNSGSVGGNVIGKLTRDGCCGRRRAGEAWIAAGGFGRQRYPAGSNGVTNPDNEAWNYRQDLLHVLVLVANLSCMSGVQELVIVARWAAILLPSQRQKLGLSDNDCDLKHELANPLSLALRRRLPCSRAAAFWP